MKSTGAKKTKIVALSGIVAAASVVIMLAAYIPGFAYAVPAFCGCFLTVIVMESGKKYAFAVYGVVSVLSFFICEKESAVSYIVFFGYYPIIKAALERIPRRALEWAAKFLLFNLAFGGMLLVSIYVFGIDAESLGDFGVYTAAVTMALGNVMFLFYDIALSKFVTLYAVKYHEKVGKLFR
ncbi:MAG: hypothetical protein ACI4IV_02615 [Acutalibacteraceae bacterium]